LSTVSNKAWIRANTVHDFPHTRHVVRIGFPISNHVGFF
jgi:hypothetical protein